MPGRRPYSKKPRGFSVPPSLGFVVISRVNPDRVVVDHLSNLCVERFQVIPHDKGTHVREHSAPANEFRNIGNLSLAINLQNNRMVVAIGKFDRANPPVRVAPPSIKEGHIQSRKIMLVYRIGRVAVVKTIKIRLTYLLSKIFASPVLH